MQFLYSGGCNSLDVVAPGDILELMAAASFFQLEDLLRYTEARCSQMIDIDNVVAMYIHAKVCYIAKGTARCIFNYAMPFKKSHMEKNCFVSGLQCTKINRVLLWLSASKYGCTAHL